MMRPRTEPRCAPSASRMPSSRVRWVTVSAITPYNPMTRQTRVPAARTCPGGSSSNRRGGQLLRRCFDSSVVTLGQGDFRDRATEHLAFCTASVEFQRVAGGNADDDQSRRSSRIGRLCGAVGTSAAWFRWWVRVARRARCADAPTTPIIGQRRHGFTGGIVAVLVVVDPWRPNRVPSGKKACWPIRSSMITVFRLCPSCRRGRSPARAAAGYRAFGSSRVRRGSSPPSGSVAGSLIRRPGDVQRSRSSSPRRRTGRSPTVADIGRPPAEAWTRASSWVKNRMHFHGQSL